MNIYVNYSTIINMNSNLENLVENLKSKGYLKTQRIIDAFLAVDRIDFVPDYLKEDAYLNIPLSIGEGQTISQPLTVAFMLELLETKEGDKVLDVGAGSGWTSALLAYLVGGKGKVIAVERKPELCEMSKNNIEKYNFIKKGIVECVCGNAVKAIKELTTCPELVEGFDKIVAAASGDTVPEIWKEQLKVGGRILVPIRSSIVQLDKIGENKFEEKEFAGFSFVPLVS